MANKEQDLKKLESKDSTSGKPQRYQKRRGPKNDVKWYLPYSTAAADIAQVSFNTAAGTSLGALAQRDRISTVDLRRVPGAMVIHVEPSLPIVTADNDALNQAFTKLFIKTRKANAGSTNYETADMAMYILALKEIDIFFAECMRLYALINKFEIKNRYWARSFIISMGYDYDDFTTNILRFRSELNRLIMKRNSLYFPGGMGQRDCEIHHFSNLFADSEDPKAQIYMFKRDAYLRWTGTESEFGTALTTDGLVWFNPKGNHEELHTVAETINMLELMIDTMIVDQDVAIISGDLEKAFQNEGIKVSLVPEQVEIAAIIDYVILTRIQNMDFASYVVDDDDWYMFIEQENGYLRYNPDYLIPTVQLGSKLITVPFKQPTADEVVELTRLMLTTELSGSPVANGAAQSVKLSSLGNLVCNGYTVVSLIGGTVEFSIFRTHYGMQYGYLPNFISTPISGSNAYLISDISCFDFHPVIYVGKSGFNNNTGIWLDGIISDLDNYITIGSSFVRDVNQMVTLGAYNITSTN